MNQRLYAKSSADLSKGGQSRWQTASSWLMRAVRVCVDSFSPVVMQNPSERRVRRGQRDYSLPFKLAVVGEVGRGELSSKQAQRRYGIRGRSTVLTWCRRYAAHFVTFQAAVPTSPVASPPWARPRSSASSS